jgi:hypothetical protein
MALCVAQQTLSPLEFPMSISPSKSNDSQDSACDVDYDGDDGFIDDLVDEEDGKVLFQTDIQIFWLPFHIGLPVVCLPQEAHKSRFKRYFIFPSNFKV